ncbi:L-lysine 6-monooxygenase (NADPH) [Segniliparus rotundus DSM 44985]|uniref:L-lysine N6-monooxygenase MbtG n=1 Tax=Segniliparus rotundus (strain ATCC BAA-972 / CDC 1076 / CIP 108378 / DSM 44985 / JCM 13578) TaxID=640132 RepID=D6ZFQ7_SEGRD|nr:SidA/IucD/PvdA family monooxygenase [Segniliparus rotundus]ADG97781.1 L-lysine 6-monooxygenase (NADPH) [Segniliparus rotundus DSM 44985]
MTEHGTLAIIGAGPKAVAVAAKASVLRSFGQSVPRIVALESREVAGHWLYGGGWTDGQQRLGTSPEKDVGFPYRSTLLSGKGVALSEAIARFSWQAYLVENGLFADWVDRGRPNPKHQTWARYLQWAAAKAQLEVIRAEATSITCEDGGWRVWARTADGGQETVVADSLMITGPGSADHVLLPDHPQVLSVSRFWGLVVRRELPESFQVAVIGGGETAAAVVNELIEHREVGVVTVLSPNPTLYTRGESYFENSIYSDPAGWQALPLAERREVIRRTDRGVFSTHVQEELLRDERIGHLRGRVAYAVDRDGRIDLMIRNTGGPDVMRSFDLVVDATGVRPLWFLDLFTQEARDLVELSAGWPVTKERVEAVIAQDLSIAGMEPKLFLPGLAGLAQGAGFPNLSCLGLLADRVLSGFVGEGPRQSLRSAAKA